MSAPETAARAIVAETLRRVAGDLREKALTHMDAPETAAIVEGVANAVASAADGVRASVVPDRASAAQALLATLDPRRSNLHLRAMLSDWASGGDGTGPSVGPNDVVDDYEPVFVMFTRPPGAGARQIAEAAADRVDDCTAPGTTSQAVAWREGARAMKAAILTALRDEAGEYIDVENADGESLGGEPEMQRHGTQFALGPYYRKVGRVPGSPETDPAPVGEFEEWLSGVRAEWSRFFGDRPSPQMIEFLRRFPASVRRSAYFEDVVRTAADDGLVLGDDTFSVMMGQVAAAEHANRVSVHAEAPEPVTAPPGGTLKPETYASITARLPKDLQGSPYLAEALRRREGEPLNEYTAGRVADDIRRRQHEMRVRETEIHAESASAKAERNWRHDDG